MTSTSPWCSTKTTATCTGADKSRILYCMIPGCIYSVHYKCTIGSVFCNVSKHLWTGKLFIMEHIIGLVSTDLGNLFSRIMTKTGKNAHLLLPNLKGGFIQCRVVPFSLLSQFHMRIGCVGLALLSIDFPNSYLLLSTCSKALVVAVGFPTESWVQGTWQSFHHSYQFSWTKAFLRLLKCQRAFLAALVSCLQTA